MDAAGISARSEPEPNTGCWLWLGASVPPYGYGVVRFRGCIDYAHRAAWQITHGDIPRGISVLHRCDNPPCINPGHLFLGTHVDNMRDMVMKGRSNAEDRNGMRRHPERAPMGERNGSARLSEADVKAIRGRCRAGDNRGTIARDYGVTVHYINDIAAGRRWAHVQEAPAAVIEIQAG